MLYLSVLCVLFIAAAISLHFARHQRWVALATGSLTLVFLLLSILWIISDQFTGEGFNSAVIYHLRVGLGDGGTREYLGIMFATFALIALAAVATAWFAWRLAKKPKTSGSPGAYLLLCGMLLLCVIHPSSNAFLAIFNLSLYGPDSALGGWQSEGTADAANHSFTQYYSAPNPPIASSQKKNLVVLYAESLERTYFDEALFPGLITELRALENEAISFTNIKQVRGTGFTIAGLVASQCGIPLITSGHPNSMRGMAEFLPGATCLGDVLKQQAYTLHYMGGASLNFAGKGKFFTTHSFDSVQGLGALQPQLDDPDYVSTWGLFDDSLLDMYYKRFAALSGSGKPFGLFGLTMDTHHPHGHASRSCDGLVYGDGSNTMLNAVKCADRLVAETVRKIRSSPWADNTIVVLASDHLALKNDVHEQLLQGERRNLFWVFPTGDQTPQQITSPGTTLDSGAAILHQLGLASSSFGLGRNMLSGESSLIETLPRLQWQLREWRAELAAFWQLPTVIDSLHVDAQQLALDIDGRRYGAPALVTFDDSGIADIRFEFDSKVSLSSYVAKSDADQLLVWVDQCERVRAMALNLPRTGHCLFAGKPGARRPLAQPLKESLTLARADLDALRQQPNDATLLGQRQRSFAALHEFGVADLRRYDHVVDAALGLPDVDVVSSGGPGSTSYVTTGTQHMRLSRGLSVLRIGRENIELIARYDSCAADSTDGLTLRDSVPAPGQPASWLLVISHDSATCGRPLTGLFADSGLSRWQDIAVRTPYAAVLLEPLPAAPVLEAVGEPLSSLLIRLKSSAP